MGKSIKDILFSATKIEFEKTKNRIKNLGASDLRIEFHILFVEPNFIELPKGNKREGVNHMPCCMCGEHTKPYIMIIRCGKDSAY